MSDHKRFRDTSSGEYVSAAEAAADPAGTVAETDHGGRRKLIKDAEQLGLTPERAQALADAYFNEHPDQPDDAA